MDIWPSLIDTRFETFEASGENRYRPITGWFERMAAEVWDFVFTSGDTIGATPAHPFYSEDRQGFVAVGELAIGERVKVSDGKTTEFASKWLYSNVMEKVCNLEVWREHNFHVGKSGQLVHNNCIDWLKIHNYAPPENSNTALW